MKATPKANRPRHHGRTSLLRPRQWLGVALAFCQRLWTDPAARLLVAGVLIPGLLGGALLASAAQPLGAQTLFVQTARSDAGLRLLLLGDSLTAGYGLPQADSLPQQLEAALQNQGWQVEVLNGGVSGDTTAGGLARLEWALYDNPDAVVVALGANDGLRGLDSDNTKANLAAILQRLSQRKLPTLLVGMYAPPNLGRQYERRYNALFPALAEEFEVLFYPFILEGVAAEPALNQADGIHPNAAGVAVIVDNLLPVVQQLLQRAAQAAG